MPNEKIHPQQPKVFARRLKRAKTALLGLGFLGVSVGGLVYFFPLELRALWIRSTLWADGVSEVRVDGIQGFQRDHCVQGQPCNCVALLHGLGDDALTWTKLLKAPRERWQAPVRLVAWNLPGVGESERPQERAGFRAQLQAEKMGTVLEKFSAECSHWLVAGNSFGGWVAGWMAVSSPKISRLLLLDAAGLPMNDVVTRWHSTFWNDPTVEGLQELQRRAYFKPRVLSPRVWRAATKRVRDSVAHEVAAAQTEADFLSSHLNEIHAPTLLIWGKSDHLVPIEVGEGFKKIAGSDLRVIPDCGHLPQKECPEAVVDGIHALLSFGAM